MSRSGKATANVQLSSTSCRVNRSRLDRIEKLSEAYQRVLAKDPDPEAAMQDVQDAILILLEEFTHTVYNGG